MAPPLLATSLGLAGCGDTAVGTPQDGTVSVDGQVDAGPVLEYMAPFDAGAEPDYAAPEVDASVEDAGFTPLYMGPPPIR